MRKPFVILYHQSSYRTCGQPLESPLIYLNHDYLNATCKGSHFEFQTVLSSAQIKSYGDIPEYQPPFWPNFKQISVFWPNFKTDMQTQEMQLWEFGCRSLHVLVSQTLCHNILSCYVYWGAQDVLALYHDSFLYAEVPLTIKVRAAIRGGVLRPLLIWVINYLLTQYSPSNSS